MHAPPVVEPEQTLSIAERLRRGVRVRVSELIDEGAEWAERDLPMGTMTPTHELVPVAQFTHGHYAIEVAELCGYDLYEFQRDGLLAKLGANMIERRDGSVVERWAASETADVISRRNGKSVEIEVLILFGLFMNDEQQIMYTAHRDDTAKSVFDNVRAAIERTPELLSRVRKNGFRVANGQRSITLKTGAVCYFRTRTNEAARGQGFDRLILDESQHLTELQMASVMPVVTGSENAQINYAGSAGDLAATVLAKVWRSFESNERSLCYRGWHADPEDDFDDLALVARNNPRLGHGLSYEFIAKEFRRMTRAQFGRERCGAATYPRAEGAAWVIPEEAWKVANDPESAPAATGRLCYVLEADRELARGTISVAGRRADGAMHLETIDHDPGVGWMPARVRDLLERHEGGEVWVDPVGPCGFMVGDLRQQGIAVRLFTSQDLPEAFSWLSTAIAPSKDPRDPQAPDPQPTARHREDMDMTLALAAAQTRKIRERLTLARTVPEDVNQGPIVGAMLAGWAVVKGERAGGRVPPPPSRSSSASSTRTRPNPRGRRSGPTSDLTTSSF